MLWIPKINIFSLRILIQKCKIQNKFFSNPTTHHISLPIILSHSFSLSKNHVQRGVQWTSLMNEFWKTCFFPPTHSHVYPPTASRSLRLSSCPTSTPLMTAPLAGTRWLPINNSHVTQVQRRPPDEPRADTHLLSESLRPLAIPNTRHSFGVSVASLMRVAGLGPVSVRVRAAYLLQGFHVFTEWS